MAVPSRSSSGLWQLIHKVTSSSRVPSIRHFSTSPALNRIHKVPVLNHVEQCAEAGVPKLFTPRGFVTAWNHYQQLMCAELTDRTVGTPEEGISTLALILKTSRDPNQAQLFNYASMAWNNHFFFDGLWLNPTEPAPEMSPRLRTEFSQCFTMPDGLKTDMIASASSMFGPGFVWLVAVRNPSNPTILSYKILCTYGAGSPHSGAHCRAQSMDMNTRGFDNTNPKVANANAINQAKSNVAPWGLSVEPLLCVNTWEHAWLRSFGVFGKEDYLEAWWNHIDWEKVESRLFDRSSSKPDMGTEIDPQSDFVPEQSQQVA